MKTMRSRGEGISLKVGGVAAGILAGLIGLLAGPSTAMACDACNMAVTDEILSTRADTPLGRDVLAAMQNQQGLPLEGLVSSHLVARVDEAISARTGISSVAAASVPATNRVPASTGTQPTDGSGVPDYFKGADFYDIIERDYGLDLPPTSFVPQDAPVDKSVTIELHEGMTYLGNGVVYDGFLTNGKTPGPTIIVDEGDVVEFVVVNNGTVPHGASIHAAGTQTSKYLGKIPAGETRKIRFRVMQPGVYMYHCAPGGHAIPMHVLFGQYGMMVVKPKKETYQLEKDLGHGPDLELYLIQNEFYASGKDAIEGNPAYVTYNGKIFRYVEDPIMVKPGDYVRIYYLNIGPNLLSTFHIVGIIWDYAYWQGHPEARWPGGQSVTAGPTDSWVVEFRVPPDEGAYTLLSHVVGSTSRGAIGLMVADRNAETQAEILADGPSYTEEELAEYKEQAQRIISPFRPGTHPVDRPVVYGPEVEEVNVTIIGNSFYPKVIQVAPGTKVTWTNEDVFAYMAGEYSGVHNVAAVTTPPDGDGFLSPLLVHGESYSHVFEEEWEYDYICTPHPYMLGRVIVKAPDYSLTTGEGSATASLGNWVLPLLALCFFLSTLALVLRGKPSGKEK